MCLIKITCAVAAEKSSGSQQRLNHLRPIHQSPPIFSHPSSSAPRKYPATWFQLNPPDPPVTGQFTKDSPIHFNLFISMLLRTMSQSGGKIVSGLVALMFLARGSGADWTAGRSAEQGRRGGEGGQRGTQEFNLPTSLNALVILSPPHTTT